MIDVVTQRSIMANAAMFGQFKAKVAAEMTSAQVKKLSVYFELSSAQHGELEQSRNPGVTLLTILENNEVIGEDVGIEQLCEAFTFCNLNRLARIAHGTFMDLKTGLDKPANAAMFGQFKAKVAAEMTSAQVKKLSVYFELSSAQHGELEQSRNPGVTLLTILENNEVIGEDVGIEQLCEAFTFCNLNRLARIAHGTFMDLKTGLDKPGENTKCFICQYNDFEELKSPTNKLLSIQCKNCKSEWTVESDSSVNSFSIQWNGMTFSYKVPLRLEPSQMRQEIIDNLDQLNPGDHIIIRSITRRYDNHAIFLHQIDKKMKIISFVPNLTLTSTVIKCEVKSLPSEVRRVLYPAEDPADIVIARAYKLYAGQNQDYNLIENNVESLASYCKVGNGFTIQESVVRDVLPSVLISIGLKSINPDQFEEMKRQVVLSLKTPDVEKLGGAFFLLQDQIEAIITNSSPGRQLLLVLEEKGLISSSNVRQFAEVLFQLNITDAFDITQEYMRKQMDNTPYERFLAGLSAHFTSSMGVQLCDHFKIDARRKEEMLSSPNPGLELLSTLDGMGIISSSYVNNNNLTVPLQESKLVQAVAKVCEYQRLLDGEKFHDKKDKHMLFIECVKSKIKSWYQTITPVPWRKSCQWDSADLFIAGSLIVNDTKSSILNANIDKKCKLSYTDIFVHKKFKLQKRIIIEGEPGSGKTMCSFQLAYDWCMGKTCTKDMTLVLFIALRSMGGLTIEEAIRKFYIPRGIPISEMDIQSFLNNRQFKNCIILDGVEEYLSGAKPGEVSEVEKVMLKEKLQNCIVVLTSRTNFIKDKPDCTLLALMPFDEEERNEYIKKVYSTEDQEKMRQDVQNSSFLMDLCKTPLLFVLVVHNIKKIGSYGNIQQRVSHFMQDIIRILQEDSGDHKLDAQSSSNRDDPEEISLAELAFNGLCKGRQQLLWEKDFVFGHVRSARHWVDSGILNIEDALTLAGETDITVVSTCEIPLGTKEVLGKHIPVENEHGKESFLPPENDGNILNNIGTASASTTKDTRIKVNASNVSMKITFLHKVVQEWYAAKHLSSLILKPTGNNNAFEILKRIDPSDLHYVLRFTCYHCPPSCHLILRCLLDDYKLEDGSVPLHIMDCIFLCFAEYIGSKQDNEMVFVLRDICNEPITINGRDSRLLQLSKVNLLQYVSHELGLAVKHLSLVNAVKEVQKSRINLSSDVELDELPTLSSIHVSEVRQSRTGTGENYVNLIHFVCNCRRITSVTFDIPDEPPEIDKMTQLPYFRTNLRKIRWKIGERLIKLLDTSTWEWTMQEFTNQKLYISGNYVSSPVGDAVVSKEELPREVRESKDEQSLYVGSTITPAGGLLQIPDTGVTMSIPPNALKEDRFIEMRIIPNGLQEDYTPLFATNIATVVELLPSDIQLHLPVLLVLPHCARLKDGADLKAKIVKSHHKEGTEPKWEEEQDKDYKLGQKNCAILLNQFCWATYTLDNDIITGKEVVVFAAKHLKTSTNDITNIEVGYYHNLPGTKESLPGFDSMEVIQDKVFMFRKEGENPLEALFDTTLSTAERLCGEEENPQKIDFKVVPLLKGMWNPFVFKRMENREVHCWFRLSQGPWGIKLFVLFKWGSPRIVEQSLPGGMDQPTPTPRAAGQIKDDLPELDVDFMQAIAKKIGDDWKFIARSLKLEEEDLTDVKKEDSEKEKVYQMLRLWKQRKGDFATCAELLKAFKRNGRTDLISFTTSYSSVDE